VVHLSPAIEACALRKEYGAKVAVASLDLTIERGEAFGFLGPNGAGKTTSIKMFLGLIKPTAGTAKLLGLPIGDPRCRRNVGFLPEHFRFHEWLRAGEFLDFHARLYDVPKATRARRIPELLEMVGLVDVKDQPLGTFSKGMLQRIGLAQALVNEPELVLLDEPTSGLDPMGRRMVRDVIAGLREHGTTVFLNSHLLSEVEITCTRVAFITEGEVRHITNLAEYEDGLLQVDLCLGRLDEGLIEGLRRWSRQIDIDADNSTLVLHLADRSALPDIARWVVGQGADLYSLSAHVMSLEELFVRIVKEAASTRHEESPCATS